uniref:universal stress protein n=1 Tax=Fulvivirga sp. TaxID=1931237 RepID=UPI00404B7EED
MNILCPIDFSETSLVALEYAVKIGQKHKANIIMVYVFSESEFNKKVEDATINDLEVYKKEALSKLERMADTIRDNKKIVTVKCHVMSGEFLQSIKNVIKSESINLIAIGSKGATNVLEKMAGTNTVKLIEGLDVPILMVPKNSDYSRINDLVYASDYSKYDINSLQQIIDILGPFHPKITFLHLTNSENVGMHEKYEEFNKRIQSSFETPINFKLKNYKSNIALAIDEYMLENKVNLLGIYMEKHNLIDRLFQKSITLQLTYMLDFPLLIIKKSHEQ